MKNRIARALTITAILAAVAGCNTVQGLGEDISSVGRAGEEAID
ncbi:entericidin A/B family lipoprotein [Erythrobacter rubeus]|uniref:Entericidin A/B family lipoprotein n=1 Tax=Erythrobacter rubeus TaxID=2760803 RepID=A0ABR8KNZ4_9SPHN|nr:entericidin A/B family lipoprotein [Erythrobacter rubeus]MBD2842364.1 entericidin A/B family lipoprotein [Erythrobacter rubeus]